MAPREAPLYVDCADLAVWLHQSVRQFSAADAQITGLPLLAEARAMLGAVAVALAFPQRRADALVLADEACARLRVFVRLARDAGPLTDAQVLFVADRLAVIGKMIGGWRRRVARHSPNEEEVDRPGAVSSAPCVAGRS